MITTDIIFDRRHKATAKKAGTIEIKVTVNRKNQYLSTGVRVLKNEWKFGQIINRPDSVELMERVQAIKKRVEIEVTKCVKDGTQIKIQSVKSALIPTNETTDMWVWLYDQIEALNVSKGTRAHYNNMMEKFVDFARIKRWEECSVENILLWDGYLHTLKKPRTAENITDAGVYNYHKCLKALLHTAFDIGKIQQNPYDRMKGKFKRGDKENVEYLTEDEMHRIENLQGLSRVYDEARDLFVVQMYTGLPYSDLMAFNIDDYKNVDGKLVKRAERIKTGVPYVSQLLPPVLKVLEKYGDRLPYINNPEYNERLKVVGRLAGIDTPLHSHLGRHTFATWMLSNGVKIEHVSKMLGHTNITQTQRYAKVLAKDVREDFDRIDAKLRK